MQVRWPQTNFHPSVERLWQELVDRHESLMGERPPQDLHRQSILGARHSHVGIGLAYNSTGVIMIEVYADSYVKVEPLPARSNLSDKLMLRGKILAKEYKLQGISVFYEPPPNARTRGDLPATGSYEFPADELILRPKLGSLGRYEGGSSGEVEVYRDGKFVCPIKFSRKRSGVYTFVVWLKGKSPSTRERRRKRARVPR